jgi:RimJ/RimL family protein N-acetyltransferase
MSVVCDSDHVDIPREFQELPESQRERWRHKCPACAYELGRRHAEMEHERARLFWRAWMTPRDGWWAIEVRANGERTGRIISPLEGRTLQSEAESDGRESGLPEWKQAQET